MEKFSIMFRRHPIKGHTRISDHNMEVTGRALLHRIVKMFTADPEVTTLAVYEHRSEKHIQHFEKRDIRTK